MKKNKEKKEKTQEAMIATAEAVVTEKKEKKAKEAKEEKKGELLEVVTEVVIQKTLKYKYPKGMIDLQKRKSFRQQVRNKIERAELMVVRAKGSEQIKEAKEALAKLKEEYLAGE